MANKYWLGKGTLGDIKTGEVIPDGYIDDVRFRAFEKKGLIGEKIAAVKDLETPEQAELNDLRAKVKEQVAEIKAVEKKLKAAEKKLAEIDSLADADDKGKGRKK